LTRRAPLPRKRMVGGETAPRKEHRGVLARGSKGWARRGKKEETAHAGVRTLGEGTRLRFLTGAQGPGTETGTKGKGPDAYPLVPETAGGQRWSRESALEKNPGWAGRAQKKGSKSVRPAQGAPRKGLLFGRPREPLKRKAHTAVWEPAPQGENRSLPKKC